jgi:hypothetical protein
MKIQILTGDGMQEKIYDAGLVRILICNYLPMRIRRNFLKECTRVILLFSDASNSISTSLFVAPVICEDFAV